MPKKIQLVPALLTYSLTEFKDKIKLVENNFSLAQIDMMDNKFVKNKTFYDLNKIKGVRTKVNYELHLMVNDPEKVIKKWQNFKKVKRIIFHYESMRNDQAVADLIDYIKNNKIKAGLAINPETGFKKFAKFLPQLDLIFIMGVKPGWSGQSLQLKVLDKVRKIRKLYPELDIEIDGGVNLKNLKKVVKSGVNILAAGSMIYSSEDIEANIKQAKKIIK